MKRQYASIDIARYVSALLVVCIHTFPFLEISETFNTYFIHTVCRLAVPFFFTTSHIRFLIIHTMAFAYRIYSHTFEILSLMEVIITCGFYQP